MTPSKFVQNEPVLIASVATALLGLLGSTLIGHHVVGNQSWTALTNELVPILVLVVPIVLGFIVRSKVFSPATAARWKEGLGLLTDADFARFEALIEDKFEPLLSPVPLSSMTLNIPPITTGTSGTTTVTNTT